MRKSIDLDRYSPLGRDYSEVLSWNGWLLALQLLISLGIVYDFFAWRGSMYQWVGTQRVLMDGAMMPPFPHFLDGYFVILPALWAVMVFEAVSNYRYHYKYAMSIYLMRRLPDRWELHRRCLVLPTLCALGSTAACGLVVGLYFVMYLVFTPAGRLPI